MADCLERPASFTIRASREVNLAPGLFTGSTGVSIFLTEAAACGVEAVSRTDAASLLPPQWRPEGDDLIAGAAGVGLGHLWLYRATGDSSHLDVARRCAEELMDGSRADPAPRPRNCRPARHSTNQLARPTDWLASRSFC